MATYQLYIARQVLRPLGIALLIALLVLLMERVLQLIDLVLGASGPLRTVFEIVAFLIPHYLSMALPISLMIGVLLGFNRMSRDGEIDALCSAGIGIARQIIPTLVIAFVFMVISAILFGYVKPIARHAYQAVVFAASNTALHLLVRAGIFTEIGDRTVLIQGIRPDGLSFAKVFIYDKSRDGTTSTIAARDGQVVRAAPDGQPVMQIFDGVRLTIEPSFSQVSPSGFNVLNFKELRLGVGPKAPLVFRSRGETERELYFNELWQMRNHPPNGLRTSDLIAELNDRLVRVFSIGVIPLIAASLAIGRTRSERFPNLALGVIGLIIYSQIIDFGKNLVESQVAPPSVCLWMPFTIFVASSLLLFERMNSRVPRGGPSMISAVMKWPRLLIKKLPLPMSRSR